MDPPPTPPDPRTMDDPEKSTGWILALYGGAMLAVQGVEQVVAMLYLFANHDPEKESNASAQRHLKSTFETGWNAFQKGTAGMKLNDAKRGIKDHLDGELYERLDKFITGPRAQLAHRFLIERITATDAGARFIPGTALYLVEAEREATALTVLLHQRVVEIVSAYPVHESPPEEVREFAWKMSNLMMRKDYPREVYDDMEHGEEPSP
jgi:hypothetical protein